MSNPSLESMALVLVVDRTGLWLRFSHVTSPKGALTVFRMLHLSPLELSAFSSNHAPGFIGPIQCKNFPDLGCGGGGCTH